MPWVNPHETLAVCEWKAVIIAMSLHEKDRTALQSELLCPGARISPLVTLAVLERKSLIIAMSLLEKGRTALKSEDYALSKSS
jgi:hypothetical protein